MNGEVVSTVLPTEPGVYLFLGIHEDSDDYRDYPELLIVTRRTAGDLMYIGRDFWYERTLALATGAWITITPSPETLAIAAQVVLDRKTALWAKKNEADWRHLGQGLTADNLCYYTSGFRRESDKMRPLVERAVQLGLLVEGGKDLSGDRLYTFKKEAP
jgi:hypothetical protein